MYKTIFKQILPNSPDANLTIQLHKKPTPESTYYDMPHFQDFKAGETCQADLLYLPEDKGFKYLLVVVDDASKQIDAEALKDRKAEDIITGFTKIFKRKRIIKPKYIEVDAGSEFKGKTKKYFEGLGISIRYAETNRHRQQGLVESKNHVIGRIIFMIQNNQELETGKQNKEWVKYINQIIDLININSVKGLEKERQKHPLTDFPVWSDNNKTLLKVGTSVRVLLNHPIEVHNDKKLSGKFRSGDIRFSKEVYLIKDILLRPDEPPLYSLDNGKSTQHTRQQLQVVPKMYYVG
jgi:hypothetical protein